MLGRTNTGGGGGLAFRVYGNPAPATPKPNDIWVDTDEKITSYIFNATEPEEYAPGMVWITIGASSTVAFSATAKNPIMVYPVSVKQYVSGAWVDKTAKSYKGGVWVDWVFMIYAYGSFSEGYSIATNSNGNVASDKISFTEEDGYIQLNSSGDLYSMFYIAPKVIRGECKTLYIAIENASMNIDSGSGKFGLSSNARAENPSFVASTSFNSFNGSKTISVDISKLPETTAYYIAIRFGLTGTSFSARVTKIWME